MPNLWTMLHSYIALLAWYTAYMSCLDYILGEGTLWTFYKLAKIPLNTFPIKKGS